MSADSYRAVPRPGSSAMLSPQRRACQSQRTSPTRREHKAFQG